MGDNHRGSRWDPWDDALPVTLEGVMGPWRDLVRGQRPWSEMPLDDLDGELRKVIVELLNLARDSNDGERSRRLVTAGERHGAFRRAQGCRTDPSRAEFGQLGHALQVALRLEGFSARLARDAVDTLEPDLARARIASAGAFESGEVSDRSPFRRRVG